MKNGIFLRNSVIFLKKKYHFSFKKILKKDRPKIYIIALDIFFHFFFNYRKKAKVEYLLGKKIGPLTFPLLV
jgi:hypothetical protein